MSKNNNKDIGTRIKSIRISLGLNMEEFGKKFDPKADKSLVSRWEKGVSKPNNDRLKRISEIGKVSMFYLLEGKLTSTDIQRAEKGTVFEIQQAFEGSSNELKENVMNYSLDFLKNYNDYDELETWSINNLYRILNTLRTIENDELSKNTKDFILVLLQNLNFEIEKNHSIDLNNFYKSVLDKTSYPEDV
ncbi:hypothetical protein BCR24_15575 [Enterococcus ureilyticus]|uniref:HTH cro/C1-type domain-containing protein n=1 Tax=Enterococcus ureilyticus TaxID=1131292 RepID=A0A1E5HBX5_9ENTE|nr:helix-turn-helix transcriptional regulator [Enterococcus ureilyticus]MBM7690209.1 transcriptional regulator with XRE-family HTH domain [Enterococcus ureilyticus]OEG22438.1 hypothetical protein BCR24_15575 [Enterococcus ureilyticus]